MEKGQILKGVERWREGYGWTSILNDKKVKETELHTWGNVSFSWVLPPHEEVGSLRRAPWA